MNQVQVVLSLVEETTYNHLMEVIIEVSSESLYNELFHKIFRNLLYDIASHKCGSFVAQALISNARSQEQVSVLCCQALIAALHSENESQIAALHSENESQTCIFPEYYFLTATFAVTTPLNVNGPLEFIQPLITSITSMEMDQVLEATQDAAGTRVIEVFLDPNASWKQKCKLIVKLQGHFGDISMHSSGSFIVEKCFTASNLSMKEVIVSELSYVRNELSKTKHGPHLIRKLNVNGNAESPEQWKKKLESKHSVYEEFYNIFGTGETKSHRDDSLVSNTSKKRRKNTNMKQLRKEIDQSLTYETPFLSKSSLKRHRDSVDDGSRKKSKSKKG
ncbi:hypothetical protein SAY86_016857 [Trapa natans]|uniref:Uncharacterized protein n=1 Tax=Trapa natans TaxID=22666 RepID=A0AAN7LJQ6_TRANT|nr:hypothetical protein SAY86_016857 [Trapa natans]